MNNCQTKSYYLAGVGTLRVGEKIITCAKKPYTIERIDAFHSMLYLNSKANSPFPYTFSNLVKDFKSKRLFFDDKPERNYQEEKQDNTKTPIKPSGAPSTFFIPTKTISEPISMEIYLQCDRNNHKESVNSVSVFGSSCPKSPYSYDYTD